ncbi:hypothetical protein IT411_00215 [Candidatus Peregrinibacteria bacterium]|nr:hypothetical protein [Candidatus Peregrinibacteria bacterium]
MSSILFEEKLLPVLTDLELKPELWPGLSVNVLFEQLMEFIEHSPAELEEQLEVALVERVRRIAGKGEFCLEKYWAEKILLGADLKTFTYYWNYQKLIDFEVGRMKKVIGDLEEILFFGSGPLPLTAILMAQNYGLKVCCVDRDEESVKVSRSLIEKLGLEEDIKVVKGDFFDFDSYGRAQIILMGALVGQNEEEKAQIVEKILAVKKSEQRGFLRTVCGMKKLLYPAVPEHLGKLICPADKKIINSLIVI